MIRDMGNAMTVACYMQHGAMMLAVTPPPPSTCYQTAARHHCKALISAAYNLKLEVHAQLVSPGPLFPTPPSAPPPPTHTAVLESL
jgi:hypothetical protein